MVTLDKSVTTGIEQALLTTSRVQERQVLWLQIASVIMVVFFGVVAISFITIGNRQIVNKQDIVKLESRISVVERQLNLLQRAKSE